MSGVAPTPPSIIVPAPDALLTALAVVPAAPDKKPAPPPPPEP